jgi:peptidoglycan/xylan/chitin deacetylase (PgdA/CDA1 family)
VKTDSLEVSVLTWPEGRRAAASFTFDVDAEAVWIGFDRLNADRPGVLSQGTYGPRVGVPLILEVLRRRGVTATFFVPGINIELHRGAVDKIVEAGHEIAIHGYTHTAPALLNRAEESEELDRAYQNVVDLGLTPTGYRSPSWDVSPSTLDLIEAKGLLYASNFMDDLRPYRHPGRRLIELPTQWILDDWPHFEFAATGMDTVKTIRSTREVEEIWIEEFEGIRELGGSFVLTMHPQISGRPSRVALLDRVIARVQSFPDVWIATCGEIARHADAMLPRTGSGGESR